MSSALLWTARRVFPAPTSLATQVALAAGVTSATQDTGLTGSQIAFLTVYVDDDFVDHIHIAFGPTDPPPDPDHDGIFVSETVNGNQPARYLVTAATRYFLLFSSGTRDLDWQAETIQP